MSENRVLLVAAFVVVALVVCIALLYEDDCERRATGWGMSFDGKPVAVSICLDEEE